MEDKEIKAYLIDFAEGRVTVPEFLVDTEKHPEILDYLTKIAGPEYHSYIDHKVIHDGWCSYVQEEIPFDAKLHLEKRMEGSYPGESRLDKQYGIHSFFSKILVEAFPDDSITVDQTLRNKYYLIFDACPEYIGGAEVEDLLDDLLESLPEGLSKTKKIKLFKEKIRELFHIEPQKYPRWIQGAEWPMGEDNIPMRFVSQKRKRGKGYENMLYTIYTFEDVKTGQQRTVEQFT